MAHKNKGQKMSDVLMPLEHLTGCKQPYDSELQWLIERGNLPTWRNVFCQSRMDTLSMQIQHCPACKVRYLEIRHASRQAEFHAEAVAFEADN